MKLTIIKTEKQHRLYLSEVEELIVRELASGSEESDRLELLTVLIDDYENKKYPIEPIDPIDAIKFRMNEKSLKQVDLAPYFGTKSRVSEVLSRKRPLTVPMIRALSIGLGISAETLIGLDTENQFHAAKNEVNWSKFPVKEMVTRGWIDAITKKTPRSIEEQVRNFISQLGETATCAAFKRTLKGDSYSPTTTYSLYAWLTRVVQKARIKKNNLGVFKKEALTKDFLKELSQLSWSEYGPLLAVEYLERHGICVVIVPALKGTLVDGAALKDEDGMPIIALTLRHNRFDNFWFTLLHEVVHIWKHVVSNETFIDDLEHSTDDKIEAEANRIARDTFIPRTLWNRSDARLSPNVISINSLSRELKIHPSIIAGRIRKETGNYTQFTDLLGQGEVRKLFSKDNLESV